MVQRFAGRGILSGLLALAMLVSMLPTSALADALHDSTSATASGEVEYTATGEDDVVVLSQEDESEHNADLVEMTGLTDLQDSDVENEILELAGDEPDIDSTEDETSEEPAELATDTDDVDDVALEVQAIGESEPNDSTSRANQINLETAYSGSIKDGTDIDYFAFRLSSSGRVRLSGTSYVQVSILRIYDAAGKEVWAAGWEPWDGNTQRLVLDWDIDLTKGTYYLAISAGNGFAGNYNFTLGFTASKESFAEAQGGSNNSIENASKASLNTAYKGQVAANDPIDYHAFYLASAGRVRFSGTSYIQVSIFRIYDSAGKEIWAAGWEPWDGNTQRLVLDWDIDLTKGTYYLAVSAGNGFTGNYNFRLDYKSSSESFTEAQGGSNNSLETASKVSLDTTYKGQVAMNDPVDYYRFSLSKAGSVTLAGTSRIRISGFVVYDAEGNQVWSKGWEVWNAEIEKMPFSWKIDLAKGTYYFRMSSGNGFTGNYSFSLDTNDLASSRVSVAKVGAKPYTGKAITPSPKVTYGGKVLKKGTDYTLSYKNNKKVGVATITIKGKGNYTGTRTVKFRIRFKDVPTDHWAYAKVHKAVDAGLIQGYSGSKTGYFGPGDRLTRGQVAVMLWRMAGRPSSSGGSWFWDVDSGAFYYDAVIWAADRGVVSGYGDGSYFGPEDYVTREQLAVMIANYAKRVRHKNVSGSASDYRSMSDRGSVSSFARGSVGWCFRKGILPEREGQTKIRPKANATRAETAAMLYALYKLK